LTPWEKIAQRLELCSQADMVICLYNPRSQGRTDQLEWAWEIMSRHKRPDTPVGMVRNAGRLQQEVFITELHSMLKLEPDMFCLIVVGNQSTYVKGRRMITPRGYVL
ncbi:MAG: cobalt-precorrin-3B C(17)-methyltransferase, partial [Syntrophomonadaceae bacterium]|nr:cobalt-precorrin-3B C(17)-methyltransferase [Syntrophomonadaceae bacterium]